MIYKLNRKIDKTYSTDPNVFNCKRCLFLIDDTNQCKNQINKGSDFCTPHNELISRNRNTKYTKIYEHPINDKL